MASEIRSRIIRGELREGDSLPVESDLCETFQVSRPTLREAFRILESEALISIRRGDRNGPTVHEPTAGVVGRYVGLLLQHRRATIRDVDGAFEMILPLAARRLAQRRVKADVEALESHIAKMEACREQSADFAEFLELLANFNYLIFKLTGNVTIAVIGRLLSEVVQLHIGAMARQWHGEGPHFRRSYADAAIKGCKRLVRLIAAGDQEGAETFWARQLDKAYGEAAEIDNADNLLDLLGTPPLYRGARSASPPGAGQLSTPEPAQREP